jgi:hypothetical protein
MTSSVIRVHLPLNSTDPKTWQDALAFAEAVVQKLGPPAKEVILLTHTKHQLKGTTLAGVLGPSRLKALEKAGTLQLGANATLRTQTLNTLGSTAKDAVILACYADDAMMTKIDGLPGVIGVVAVPEFPDDIKRWVERWNPIDPTQAAKPAVVLIADTRVEKAMESLTKQMNLSNGLLTPPYKEKVDEVLRILFARGHTTDTTKLESWAIKNGWRPTMAAELRAMANKVFGLASKPSLAKFINVQAKYDSWA